MVNVWTLKKAVSIKHLVYECFAQFGNQALDINTSVTNDEAILIQDKKQPELSAYVYSFSQAKESYGVDLFYPITAHDIVGKNEALSLDQLLSILQIHFDLSRVDVKAL